MMPNFVIVGAQKAGTTALHAYLDQHPEVYMSPAKEPRFFAFEHDDLDYRGPDDPARVCRYRTLEAYQALFRGAGGAAAIGEASTVYLHHEAACDNLHRHIPDARIVAILRDPVDRAYSAYLYARRDGREPIDDFERALEAEPERIAAKWGPLWHYHLRSTYADPVARYLERFDRDRVLVLLYDDLRARPEATLSELFSFLGVDPRFRPDTSVRHNVSGLPRNRGLLRALNRPHPLKPLVKRLVPAGLRRGLVATLQRRSVVRAPPLEPAVRRRLIDRFRPDIAALAHLIDRDLSAWTGVSDG